jgi:ankyrin repeat protein
MKKYNNFISESISDILKNNLNNIQSLIDLNIDINTKDEKNKTLLYYAILYENLTACKILLNNKEIDVNACKLIFDNHEINNLLLDKKELILDTKDVYNIVSIGSYDNIIKMLNNFNIDLLTPRKKGKSSILYYILYDSTELENNEINKKYLTELEKVLTTKYSKEYKKFKTQMKVKRFNL